MDEFRDQRGEVERIVPSVVRLRGVSEALHVDQHDAAAVCQCPHPVSPRKRVGRVAVK